MRPILAALSMAMLPALIPQGTAQPLQSFEELGCRVNLGDRVGIREASGAELRGSLAGLTFDGISIRSGDALRHLPKVDVSEVTLRRSTGRRGALIGMLAGAALGALVSCRGGEDCPDGTVLLGAIGSGVGAIASKALAKTRTIYRRPETVPSMSIPARLPGPFDELALRVDVGDRVRVQEPSGVRTTGRLTAMTGDEITLQTGAGERRFTSARVATIAGRRYSAQWGAVLGAGAFAALAAASASCRENPNCSPLTAAPFGAGVGLAVGRSSRG